MTEKPRHPNVVVHLAGTDGDTRAVMEVVNSAMRECGLPASVRRDFRVAAANMSYQQLMFFVVETVTVID